MTRCVHAVLQLLGASLLATPVAADVNGCNSKAGWVGAGVGGPVRAELAALPSGTATGRQKVRYLVRLSPACLLTNGLETVGSMLIGFSNQVEVGNTCTPAMPGKKILILYGQAPRGERLRVDTLRRARARIFTPDEPMAFGLEDPLTVSADADVVLGVEIEQEPGECPLLYTGPFERDPTTGTGSYIQLVDFEYLDEAGIEQRHPFDCDRNDVADTLDGIAFHVGDEKIQSNCRFAFEPDSFEWLIRAGGTSGSKRPPDTVYDLTRQDGTTRGIKAPVKISDVPPSYTQLARNAGIQGTVVMHAIIDRKGRVRDPEVIKGLPMGLSEQAVKAVKRWRYKPATLAGEPVEVRYIVVLNFRLGPRI